MRGRTKDMPPEECGDPGNVYAIRGMLPTWRAWGRVVLDMGEMPPNPRLVVAGLAVGQGEQFSKKATQKLAQPPMRSPALARRHP